MSFPLKEIDVLINADTSFYSSSFLKVLHQIFGVHHVSYHYVSGFFLVVSLPYHQVFFSIFIFLFEFLTLEDALYFIFQMTS